MISVLFEEGAFIFESNNVAALKGKEEVTIAVRLIGEIGETIKF